MSNFKRFKQSFINVIYIFYSIFLTNEFAIFFLDVRLFYCNNYNTGEHRSTEIGEHTKIKCNADIAFVVDSSRSIQWTDFKEQMIPFMVKLVSLFDLGPDAAQFSALSYGSETRIDYMFSDYTTAGELDDKIKETEHMRGTCTRTYAAIHKAHQDLFKTANGARNGVRKVMIVFTDGRTNPGRCDRLRLEDALNLTQLEAKEAKDDDITMISVGIGQKTDEVELRGIASDPSGYNHIDSFKDLNDERFMLKLGYTACMGMLRYVLILIIF